MPADQLKKAPTQNKPQTETNRQIPVAAETTHLIRDFASL